MSAPEELDLLVIGGGPAGEKGAAQAAYFGKRVAVVERAKEPGGAAVHTGTLPSKTLREAALYLSGHRSRELYGVAVDLEARGMLQGLMRRKAAIAAAESQRIRHNLARHQVELIEGHARFTGPHEVCVTHADGSTRTLRATFVLVATGTKPRQPEEIDFTSPLVHDSDEVLEIGELPRSLTILGAGVIGCEYACMFAALGIRVELVEPRSEILGFMDREMVAALERAMAELGVTLHLGRPWGAVTLGDDGKSVEEEQVAKGKPEKPTHAAQEPAQTATTTTTQLGAQKVTSEPQGAAPQVQRPASGSAPQVQVAQPAPAQTAQPTAGRPVSGSAALKPPTLTRWTDAQISAWAEKADELAQTLPVAGTDLTVHSVNTGVPHAVVFVEDLDNVPVREWGAGLRYHEAFKPKGTNANFAKVLAPGSISIRLCKAGVERARFFTRSMAEMRVSVVFCKLLYWRPVRKWGRSTGHTGRPETTRPDSCIRVRRAFAQARSLQASLSRILW